MTYRAKLNIAARHGSTLNGRSFEDILSNDILDILVEAGGEATATDLVSSLRDGARAQYLSQSDKPHFWTIGNYEASTIGSIAEELGFSTGPARHRKTGKPIKYTTVITL